MKFQITNSKLQTNSKLKTLKKFDSAVIASETKQSHGTRPLRLTRSVGGRVATAPLGPRNDFFRGSKFQITNSPPLRPWRARRGFVEGNNRTVWNLVFGDWFLFGIWCLVIGILFNACAKAPPHVATVGGTRNAQAILVERTLEEAESRVKTLRGLAEAVLVDKDESRRTDVAIVISRPNKIRADAVDTLADVWAAAGTDGKRLWLWLPQKEKLYRGAATPHNLKKLAAFDWEISELSSVIAGLVPGARNAELDEVDGDKKVHYVFRDKPVHLWVDPKTRNPVRLVRYKSPPLCKGREGGVDPPASRELGERAGLPPPSPPYKGGDVDNCGIQYEVVFSDYRPAGDGSFPYDIEVTFPERDCSFYLHYKEVELNAIADPSLFKPEDVWRKQTVEMDK